MTNDDIKNVAETIATYLGQMVDEDEISPPDVLVGGLRACIAFWGGCVLEGKRIEGMGVLKQVMTEEIDSMVRGMANGMVPQ
jgi:hypothetical protein